MIQTVFSFLFSKSLYLCSVYQLIWSLGYKMLLIILLRFISYSFRLISLTTFSLFFSIFIFQSGYANMVYEMHYYYSFQRTRKTMHREKDVVNFLYSYSQPKFQSPTSSSFFPLNRRPYDVLQDIEMINVI